MKIAHASIGKRAEDCRKHLLTELPKLASIDAQTFKRMTLIIARREQQIVDGIDSRVKAAGVCGYEDGFRAGSGADPRRLPTRSPKRKGLQFTGGIL